MSSGWNSLRCKENIVVDALSKRYALLTSLQTKLRGFEFVNDLYADDFDFGVKKTLEIFNTVELTESAFSFPPKTGVLCVVLQSSYSVILLQPLLL